MSRIYPSETENHSDSDDSEGDYQSASEGDNDDEASSSVDPFRFRSKLQNPPPTSPTAVSQTENIDTVNEIVQKTGGIHTNSSKSLQMTSPTAGKGSFTLPTTSSSSGSQPTTTSTPGVLLSGESTYQLLPGNQSSPSSNRLVPNLSISSSPSPGAVSPTLVEPASDPNIKPHKELHDSNTHKKSLTSVPVLPSSPPVSSQDSSSPSEAKSISQDASITRSKSTEVSKHPAAFMILDKDTGQMKSIFQVDEFGRDYAIPTHKRKAATMKARSKISSNDVSFDISEKNQILDSPKSTKQSKSKSSSFRNNSSLSVGKRLLRKSERLSWGKGRSSNTAPAGIFSEEDDPTFTKILHHKSKKKIHFNHLHQIQSWKAADGPIWTARFNPTGEYLATGGRDGVLRIFKVKNALEIADDTSRISDEIWIPSLKKYFTHPVILEPTPFRQFLGHKSDILTLSWAPQNPFILTSSLDSTVRLWHLDRPQSLWVFQHPDVVTSVSFHPKQERLFITGCYDKKIRLWDIVTNQILSQQTAPDIITATAFNSDGTHSIVGCCNGFCAFYKTSGFSYVTQFLVKSRRGKNRKGSKITGLSLSSDGDKMLISTNDSRSRLYRLSNYSLLMKFKGNSNKESQIFSTFDPSSNFIISGSENHSVYIWNTSNVTGANSKRPDHNEYFESFLPNEFDPGETKGVQDGSSSKSSSKPKTPIICAIFGPTTLGRHVDSLYSLLLSPQAKILTSPNVSTPPMKYPLLDTQAFLTMAFSSEDSGTLVSPPGKRQTPPIPVPTSSDNSLLSDTGFPQIIVTTDYSGIISLYVNRKPLKKRSKTPSL